MTTLLGRTARLAAAVALVCPALLSQASQFALRFHGTDDGATDLVRIRIDDNSPGNHSDPADIGQGSFTLEFWVRGTLGQNPTPWSGGGEFSDARWRAGALVLDRTIFAGSRRDFGVSFAGGRVSFGTGSGDQSLDAEHTLEGDVLVLDDTWHHIACVRDAATGTKRIFVDASLDIASSPNASRSNLSFPNSGIANPPSPWQPWLFLGARKRLPGPPGTGTSYRGLFDELRLWTTARTANELAGTFDQVLDGDEAGLTAYYRIEEGSGQSAPDWSTAIAAAGQVIDGSANAAEWVAWETDVNLTAPVKRQPLAVGFEQRVLSHALVEPVCVVAADDGRLFVGQRNGVIRIWHDDELHEEPLIELPADTSSGERGLIELALDPNFALNGYLYAYYTTSEPRNRVSRVRVIGDSAALSSEVVIWQNPELAAQYHHGGALAFDAQGHLLIATGDQMNSLNSRNLASPHGKLLRLEPDGSIPLDNPFLSQPGALPEIFAAGLRNPFRMAVDPLTGAAYVGDVGGNSPQAFEELNAVRGGADYGWPEQEGDECRVLDCTGLAVPSWSYRHDDTQFVQGPVQACIVAGAFCRSSQFPASMAGDLLVADYANRWVRRVIFDSGGAITSILPFLRAPDAGSIVDLAFGADGSLYYITIGLQNSGAVDLAGLHQIRYTGATADGPQVHASADRFEGLAPLAVQFSSAGTIDPVPGPGPLQFLWLFGDGSSSSLPDPVHVYTTEGIHSATLWATDGASTVVSPALRIEVGERPAVQVCEPFDGQPYEAGEWIKLSASASVGLATALPDDRFAWQVLLVHEEHSHPFVGPLVGNDLLVQIPTQGHPPSHSHFQVVLTVTGDNGLATVERFDLKPLRTRFRLESAPPGIPILVDGELRSTPATIESLIGFEHVLEAPADFGDWHFHDWSNGGARQQLFVAPERGAVLRVFFTH